MFDIGSIMSSIGTGGVFNFGNIPGLEGNLTVPYSTLDQGMVEQPLFAGTFDPSTLMPGMGLAGEVPEAPPYEYFQSLFGIQNDHTRVQNEAFQEAQGDILAKKERVFVLNHYEFNEDGSPIQDETSGKPKLFEGGESAEQRGQRISFETIKKDELHDHQEAEFKALQDSSKVTLEEANKAYAANPSDPEALNTLREVTASISAEEAALKMEQAKENLTLGLDGLPDPDSTDDPPKTLTEFAEGKFTEYQNLVASHQEEEAQSNENVAITGYFQQLIGFIDGQRLQLAELQAQAGSSDVTMDPEAIRKLIFGS